MSKGKNEVSDFICKFGFSLVYCRKLDYLEAAINRGNQISGDCNVCVIVKLESRNDIDVKDCVNKTDSPWTILS